VISTRTGRVVKIVQVARFPGDVALSPDGAQAWVPAGGNQSRLVSVLSTRTGAVIRRIRAGRFPAWVAFGPGGGRAWVANSVSQTLSEVATRTGQVIAAPAVGPGDDFVAIAPVRAPAQTPSRRR
jgi:DNA-binding beta-propeller fold protein YncE